MKPPILTPGRWRAAIWLAGAAGCLLYYGIRAAPVERRTSVGVERRLFALGGVTPGLHQSPSGGRWIFVPAANAPPLPPGWTGILLEKVLNTRWPGRHPSPRSLTIQPEGTWWLDGGTLRRAWRYPADDWIDDRHLIAQNNQEDHSPILDVRTGRTYLHEAAGDLRMKLTFDPDNDYEEEPDFSSVFSSALEEFPEPITGSMRTQSVETSQGTVYLLSRDPERPGTSAIYLVSSDDAPRVVRLAERARFLNVFADARALFFERDGALWRLDLRRPLLDLLKEQQPPPLPEAPD